MISPLLAESSQSATQENYVVTADGVTPLDLFPAAERGAALDTLVAQEVLGRRLERVPERVAELLHEFGFEWEPLCEPGHMRMLDYAVFMTSRSKDYAAAAAVAALRALGVPHCVLGGVSLVGAADPVMRDYLTLTAAEPDLYGDAPYEVISDHGSCLLRQTSCFQKYSVCRDRRLTADALPFALFEISDSFRREPEETLQLSYRLRHFHLPEAHVHGRSLAEAIEMSGQLHQQILGVLADLDAGLVLLVNATHRFAAARPDYFVRLAEQAGCPALLRVAAPGRPCQDGVEVDVEYKIIDSLGCSRELSTFQIDEEITRRFGVRCDDGTSPATIHLVLTGGVERYVFFALDRIARGEAAGELRHLPLWLAPVVARVVPASAAAAGVAVSVADRLMAAGVRTEIDDRGGGPEAAIAHADALLVPYVVLVDFDGGVRVRHYGSTAPGERHVYELIERVRRDSGPRAAAAPVRLSRSPFARSQS